MRRLFAMGATAVALALGFQATANAGDDYRYGSRRGGYGYAQPGISVQVGRTSFYSGPAYPQQYQYVQPRAYYGSPNVQYYGGGRGHYDYHPGGFVPHRGHYHYEPGHYDYHRGRHHHD